MIDDAFRQDDLARERAIDPGRSFIVQAPAGSGKTSLLTQRFLALLAVAERPEEIVAITFTRKAAAEMRHRIIAALAQAGDDLGDDASAHARRTQALARAALDNARARGWDLERHPSRLHIQTIDGLNHWLSRRLPLQARLGLAPALLDDARPVYAEAARQFVARLEEDSAVGEALRELARVLNHVPAQLEALVADMLARRELWLPKVLELTSHPAPRAEMERLLQRALHTELTRIRAQADTPLMARILEVLALAAEAGDEARPLAALAGATSLPAAQPEDVPVWRALAAALVTAKGAARKRLTVNEGFPPRLKTLKQRMGELLEQLAEAPDVCDALAGVAELPPAGYSDAQWSRVAALMHCLLPAAAELQAMFAARGQLDHAAVAAGARDALGEGDAPSDLAQALEYRIRHLLVDEYQDTSPVQERLLERLVAGWSEDDGHTLFCVGDPMQSVYGFREADVTLFLEAQARGIGSVRLEPLRLARNFRSCRAVIEWVNSRFGQLLPAREDYERGAVRYSPSAETRQDEAGAGVQLHPLIGRDSLRAARHVVELVERTLSDSPPPPGEGARVAILVRSRSQLPPILAELRRRGIEYRGIELETLADRPVVRDLLALTRALLHWGDRTAWLAILRAPWCGLTLADLHTLAGGERGTVLLDRLRDADLQQTVTADARLRLQRVLPVLEQGLKDRGRSSLGSWVRTVWYALDGPATLAEASDLANAEACFAALDRLGDETAGLPTASEVQAAVDGLAASPVGSATAALQLMTIHRAKGLEFDTVIVPGLERGVPSSERQLLYWAPVAVEPGARGIVLASHSETGDGQDPDALEAWMRRLDRERSRLEIGRLAYVAATRARRALHLVASMEPRWVDGEPELRAPRADTLLGFLWPAVETEFREALSAAQTGGELAEPDATARPRRTAPPLERLAAEFVRPEPPPAARPAAARAAPVDTLIRPHFDWAGAEAVAVGTLVHAELEQLARAALPAARLEQRPEVWKRALLRLGLPAPHVAAATTRVGQAIENLAASPVAARLLDPASVDPRSELALTAWLDGEFASVKIDRTFVDAEGFRWIVDWKTSSHEGGATGEFLTRELERYTAQLERYARIMRRYDGRPQRVGLYFPLLDAWQEWRPPGGSLQP